MQIGCLQDPTHLTRTCMTCTLLLLTSCSLCCILVAMCTAPHTSPGHARLARIIVSNLFRHLECEEWAWAQKFRLKHDLTCRFAAEDGRHVAAVVEEHLHDGCQGVRGAHGYHPFGHAPFRCCSLPQGPDAVPVHLCLAQGCPAPGDVGPQRPQRVDEV